MQQGRPETESISVQKDQGEYLGQRRGSWITCSRVIRKLRLGRTYWWFIILSCLNGWGEGFESLLFYISSTVCLGRETVNWSIHKIGGLEKGVLKDLRISWGINSVLGTWNSWFVVPHIHKKVIVCASQVDQRGQVEDIAGFCPDQERLKNTGPSHGN